MSRSDKLCNIIGSNFKSSLYSNYLTKYKPRHLEYFPLVNSRAHKIGDDEKSAILNNEFRLQYDAFLSGAIEKEKLGHEDILCYAYFLLLQDRINEAIDIFEKITLSDLSEEGSLVLQYDYMSAYIDFYIGAETNYQVAREICRKYQEYPVLHWRSLFDKIADHLREFDGEMEVDYEINQDSEGSKEKNLKKSKELEPILNAVLKTHRIQVDYQNIESIEIKYYMIDPEILFSRAPFIYDDTEDLAFVKPSLVAHAILNPALKTELIDIEKSLINGNMIIEVSGSGKQVFLRHFSTSLKVWVMKFQFNCLA